ncbi:NADAR family protein [Burkholderia cenocepacia]|uniref:NADAR family protein n=1 Tax=Burkholderia cenocepacia TaxID=95486 RepID=UPI001B9000E3|nr:NADAR family protein [Burkholderia cenocepacia]MBR8043188.1 NADAR family protein [Burkholderia cenocepacia]MBR8324442.1 NADAR family protein [Burkholderia cenocepacia]
MHHINNMTLFFGAEDALSNWHQCRFEYHGVAFTCVEQFMMYAKAKLFEDHATAAAILAATDPRKQKQLGREVKGFNDAVWVEKREAIVTVGCREKFQQNPSLRDTLLATGDTVLVEASPYDRIWGVGFAWNDPLILDPKNWRGTNLLGKTLTTVRQLLKDAQAASKATDHQYWTGADIAKLPADSTKREWLTRYVADGGLAICRVCGLGEGALTTHCPGARAGAYADDVYAGKLDFVEGSWVNRGNPTNQMWDRVADSKMMKMADSYSRQEQLNIIYETTHGDFKGIAGERWPAEHQGKRTILVNDKGATILALLENLTDEQIADKLPLALKTRAKKQSSSSV